MQKLFKEFTSRAEVKAAIEDFEKDPKEEHIQRIASQVGAFSVNFETSVHDSFVKLMDEFISAGYGIYIYYILYSSFLSHITLS